MRKTNLVERAVTAEKRVEYEHKKRKEAERKWKKALLKIKKLENIIRKFHNENTPSSALPVYLKSAIKSPNRLPVGINPRGKPKGGNGGTRKIPEKINREIKVPFNKEQLAKLKKKYGDKIRIEEVEKYVWEVPERKIFVTKFLVQRAYVGKKLVSQAIHAELPKKGIFGNRLRSEIITLKDDFPGSYKKIAEHIQNSMKESFSPQAIKDCVHR